jgi:outer membrane protein assembly factor BamB
MMGAARVRTAAALAIAIAAVPSAAAVDWAQFARGPHRLSIASAVPQLSGPPVWVLATAAQTPITFVGQAGVVAHGGKVFAVGRLGTEHRAFAASATAGHLLWTEPVPAPHMDSWSTPAVDARNGTVIVASGAFITARDLATGVLRWQTPLLRNIVNASPLVTSDLGAANRIFITDYDGFGGNGRLYCINVDPFDAAANPFQPGQILWSVVLGSTSGNTPAYSAGVVYVASVSDPAGLMGGQVRAFPAAATTTPEPLWVFSNPAGHGFFGGVSVGTTAGSPAIYAASYALYGGQFAANLVKIDGATGQLLWSVASNRTDATPIPLLDGRVVLSGGLHGFGSIPSVQLFQDHGAAASLLWDSALDTWIDLNQNGVMDPGEYLAVGGWTHQPVAATAPGGWRLIAGAIPALSFEACSDMYELNLEKHPQDAGFVKSHIGGAGSTPAVAAGRLFTVGPDGLHAFGGCYANCDGSTAHPILNVEDFTCFINAFAQATALPQNEQVDHYANCDGSTAAPVLNVEDFTCFINAFARGCG